MRNHILKWVSTLSFALIPFAVWAGEHAEGGHSKGWMDWVGYPVINFSVLVLLLVLIGRKGIAESFRSRSRQTKKEVEENAKLYNDIKAKFDEIDAKLSQVKKEGETLVADVQNDAKLEHDRILDSAKQAAQRIEKDAERIIDQELRRAKQQIKEEAVRLAADLAVKDLSTLSAEKQTVLTEEFLTQLAREKV